MEIVKKEFDAFLHDLVKSYPKTTIARLNPESLQEIVVKSYDFFEKSKNKINDLTSAYNYSKNQLHVELAELLIKYHGILMKGEA